MATGKEIEVESKMMRDAANEIHEYVKKLVAPWTDFRGHEFDIQAILHRHIEAFDTAAGQVRASLPMRAMLIAPLRKYREAKLVHAGNPKQLRDAEARWRQAQNEIVAVVADFIPFDETNAKQS